MEQFTALQMWMVTPAAKMEKVIAYMDANGKIPMFRTCEDVSLSNGEHFFKTEDEAKKWQSELIKEIRSKAKLCKSLIEELDEIYAVCDFTFNADDYLGSYAKSDGLREEYVIYENACHILSLAACCGVINMNGRTVKMSEVISINWHNHEKATLVLKNGSIETCSEAEYLALQLLYGNNRSGKVINKTNDK